MNVLLITVDDMNYNSKDFLKKEDSLTPNIDSLRKDSLLFRESFVTIAVCQPSRSVLMTGKYPSHNGAEGFEAIFPETVTLSRILRENGYHTGIIGKENHIAPKESFCWDEYIRTYCEEEGWGRDPEVYGKYTRQVIQDAKKEGKPFFLMANSHDPHRPYAGSEDEISFFGKNLPYEERYTEEDVKVPGFLPDLKEIRTETAQYLNSVYRADQCVGEILKALKEENVYEDTVITFLSDNGMAMPFAKANCYLNSNRSPFLFRWPGHTLRKESEALVASIDYMPTILDILGIPAPADLDGMSMQHLFEEDDYHYDDVFTSFYKTAKNQITKKELHLPMRGVQNHRYLYIYNAWSNGETKYTSESMSGLTYNAMEKAEDPEIQERVRLYRYRVKEEFYDTVFDPDARKNLAEDETYASLLQHYRERMHHYMKETNDILLEKYTRDILKKEGE